MIVAHPPLTSGIWPKIEKVYPGWNLPFVKITFIESDSRNSPVKAEKTTPPSTYSGIWLWWQLRKSYALNLFSCRVYKHLEAPALCWKGILKAKDFNNTCVWDYASISASRIFETCLLWRSIESSPKETDQKLEIEANAVYMRRAVPWLR